MIDFNKVTFRQRPGTKPWVTELTGSLQVSAALEVHRWESEKNPKLIEDTQKMIKRMIAREILEEIRTAAEPIMIEALRYAPDMHVYRVQEQVAKLRALLSPNV